jgi:altronate dehydratase small subunit
MRAIVIHPNDNVATALDLIPAHTPAKLIGAVENMGSLIVKTDIPIGHKFAVRRIVGEVIKYGEVIGEATVVIEPGEHVHVHNVKSLRGRGDLGSKE